MDKKDFRIVFFGTPEFAVESLDALVSNGFNVVAVVTMPDKIAGRGHKLIQSDVKKYAVEKGLPVLQPDNLKNPEFINELKDYNADLFIVIAFRMLPMAVWQMPPCGTFNLHASLLPKYRGAAPINRAIMEGETETGITTFFLRHEIDTGDIIKQCKIEIKPEDNAGTVHDKLMHLGAGMVVETVADIIEGTVTQTPQPEGEFTPAPKIFKETCKINWNEPTERIFNLIRGLSPYPAAFTNYLDQSGKEFTIKIFEAQPACDINAADDAKPGSALILQRNLYVKTGDGWLKLISIQPQGKKSMKASDFLLGYNPVEFL